MTIRRITTGKITAAVATETFLLSTKEIGPFKGKVEKISVIVSASTDFEIYTTQSDGSTQEEYILGADTAPVTIASDKVLHPLVLEQKAVDGSNLATYTAPIVYGDIKLEITGLTAADTYEVIFFISDR